MGRFVKGQARKFSGLNISFLFNTSNISADTTHPINRLTSLSEIPSFIKRSNVCFVSGGLLSLSWLSTTFRIADFKIRFDFIILSFFSLVHFFIFVESWQFVHLSHLLEFHAITVMRELRRDDLHKSSQNNLNLITHSSC